MDVREFKAWFKGFSENIEIAPTFEQWTRLTEVIKGIAESAPSSVFQQLKDDFDKKKVQWPNPSPRENNIPSWPGFDPKDITFLNATVAGNFETARNGFKPWTKGTYFGMDFAAKKDSSTKLVGDDEA